MLCLKGISIPCNSFVSKTIQILRVSTSPELENDNQLALALKNNTVLRGFLIEGLQQASVMLMDALFGHETLEFFHLNELTIPTDYIPKLASSSRKVVDFSIQNVDEVIETIIDKQARYCVFDNYV